jgi:hypothetical protein
MLVHLQAWLEGEKKEADAERQRLRATILIDFTIWFFFRGENTYQGMCHSWAFRA